jgi:hypothetical protein
MELLDGKDDGNITNQTIFQNPKKILKNIKEDSFVSN